ncbi:BlaI/MecI/CopY family transcriptional regulator [Runella aurantiaca]|uniref:BlaI/MecI/CopY family transcriptional regulator n=1 Tax=Runella aurantiaca TaxID=2282308 RepID=A0A369IFR7_9BACT|nr:BlaI/MecI/CopY family transcriptional regulator [Runella aurantiaca]RDB06333.1 BlaI/MecI/CopY family transcriptional regulator [Runella aurantiaca]
MEELTRTEERIMQIIWDLGRCFVKDVIDRMDDDPKPPYNTISSVVRILEKKGYVGFKAYGKTYEYFPIVAKEDYGKQTFRKVLANYFDNSPASLLSFMVNDKTLDATEIERLRQLINNQ